MEMFIARRMDRCMDSDIIVMIHAPMPTYRPTFLFTCPDLHLFAYMPVYLTTKTRLELG